MAIEAPPSTPFPSANPPLSYRRHDLDNLRTCLTGLVIVHHASISFGGLGSWPYKSTNFTGLSPASAAFGVFNQSFFMGLFFWISGRGSAQSLASAAKKPGGYVGFVRGKMKRLVLPAVVYSVCVDPLVRVLGSAPFDASTAEVGKLLVKQAKDVVVSCKVRGPVWYLVTLAMFDIVAVGAHAFLLARRGSKSTSTKRKHDNEKRPSSESKPTVSMKPPSSASKETATGPSFYRLLSLWGWIPVGLTCFALRLREPVPGMTTPIISLQLGYAAQYVYAYVLGLLSISYDESRMVGLLDCLFSGSCASPTASHLDTKSEAAPDEDIGRRGTDKPNEKDDEGTKPLVIATAISLSLLTAMLAPTFLFSRSTTTTSGVSQQLMSKMWGSWHPLALSYAIWNEFSFVLMGPALMGYFQRWHSTPPHPEKKVKAKKASVVTARNAYAAFLAHAPVTVAVARAADVAWLSVRGYLTGSSLGNWTDTSALWNAFLGPVFMTTVVGSVGVYASFLVGKIVLEWIPRAKTVL